MGVPVLLKLADNGFVLEGLPVNSTTATPNLPDAPALQAWLYPDTAAEILRVANTSPSNRLLLGPEPIIPAQALRLVSRESGAQLVLRTAGLHSFHISSGASP